MDGQTDRKAERYTERWKDKCMDRPRDIRKRHERIDRLAERHLNNGIE
jgi:hypothetical protein